MATQDKAKEQEMRALLRELELSNPSLRRLRWKRRLRVLRRAVVVAAFVWIGWTAAAWNAKGDDVEHYVAMDRDGPFYSMLDLRYIAPFRERRA